MEIEDSEMCFACGKDNPIGLKLDFELNDDVVETTFTPRNVHQGFTGIVHGGLLSTLLDEAMANLLYLQDLKAVTAKMEVKFRQPVSIGEDLTITGWIEREKKRTINTVAKILNQDQQKVAEAEAVFIKQNE
ncbi:PaaI family thioesterase [Acetohalobium arabaticum]|uniref:Acyl-coenzyme A thioesterase THEM4 n=1 Tax=Acetohalobium arabaticum (strain ATCC 49924 / DSM 5501 / Z-7288) TaxID=574087 RepID=D9QU86_ACEAZ|nr:PaaI family thioesterase [Acetohalobium arabaticum]ADL11879.1 thioesterase superfamily protein [Acetohalobium arabaticum DSM 5501]